jgi:hypothetical protein
MELKVATIEYLEILTQMNIQLREDEQIDNIMPLVFEIVSSFLKEINYIQTV